MTQSLTRPWESPIVLVVIWAETNPSKRHPNSENPSYVLNLVHAHRETWKKGAFLLSNKLCHSSRLVLKMLITAVEIVVTDSIVTQLLEKVVVLLDVLKRPPLGGAVTFPVLQPTSFLAVNFPDVVVTNSSQPHFGGESSCTAWGLRRVEEFQWHSLQTLEVQESYLMSRYCRKPMSALRVVT